MLQHTWLQLSSCLHCLSFSATTERQGKGSMRCDERKKCGTPAGRNRTSGPLSPHGFEVRAQGHLGSRRPHECKQSRQHSRAGKKRAASGRRRRLMGVRRHLRGSGATANKELQDVRSMGAESVTASNQQGRLKMQRCRDCAAIVQRAAAAEATLRRRRWRRATLGSLHSPHPASGGAMQGMWQCRGAAQASA